MGAGNVARCDKQNDEATARLLDSIPGAVFTAGDNVYSSGSLADFTKCYGSSWGRHQSRTRPAAGDKDYLTTGATGYFAYFGSAAGDTGKGYYSYDLGAWHIMVLNSNIAMSAGSPQEQWLRAELAANIKRCTLAYWHHPRFSSTGTSIRSSVKALWSALYVWNADIVINAHYRVYERFASQTPDQVADTVGIRQFTVGTGGQGADLFGTPIANSEVRSSGTYGVLKLTLSAGSYAWDFVPVAGGTFTDSGSGLCHTKVAVASVSVTPTAASLHVGGTVQLTATPQDAAGSPLTGRAVTWSSGAPALATVDGNGLVTGAAVGSATITATSEGKSGTSAITVTTVPVSTVVVTPTSPSVPVGATVRLTATPQDSAGTPLNGLILTWNSSATSIATVDSSGLVTGVATGSATITATSEGKSGTSAVTVTAPSIAGSCLTQPGSTITVSGAQTAGFNNPSLPDNTKVDASAAQYSTSADVPVFIGGGSSLCWHGGEIIGQLSPSTPYSTLHATYGLVAHGGFFQLENLRVFDYGDGASMDANLDATWSIRGVHFKYIRDDCVENDFVNSGTIDDSFFEGCYEGFSSRPYTSPTQDGSNNLVVVKNSLFMLQDMDQGYLRPGHGGFFKWASTAPMISLYNNVYRVDSPNLENDVLAPPAGKLKDCANNVMIWLGSGPFPEPLPSCFTLLTGAAGLQYWNNAVAQWKANHPNPSRDIGPPIVSMWSPSAGTTLTGIVTLTATAVDDQDVAGVQFQLNGQNIGAEVTTESPITKFTLSWDSHGVQDGTFTLTATARDASGNTATSAGLTVTISQVQIVTVSPGSATVAVGETLQLTATPKDASGNPLSGRVVAWAASPGGVVTVSSTGLVAGVGVGTGTITAASEGQSGTATVTVTAVPVASVDVTPASASVPVGGTAQLTATPKDASGNPLAGRVVTWAASPAGIATVSGSGLVTGVGVGSTTITATSETKTGTSTVAVTPPITAQTLVGTGQVARCDYTNDEATALLLDNIPGTVFTTGDNVRASGSLSDFTTCYDPSWGRHKARTRPSVGDLDYQTAGASGYFDYFGTAAGDRDKGYYSYELGDWHVIVLNSNIDMTVGSPQEQWLRADLAASSKRCTLAYWHHPRFSSYATTVRSSVKPLWDALYAARAEVVINAHYRLYERFAPQTPDELADPQNGIRQFTVGTGGHGIDTFGTTFRPNSEVRSSGTYGLLELTLATDGYTWAFVPIAGQTFTDAGSGSCH